MGMILFYNEKVHIAILDLLHFQSRKFHFYENLFLDQTSVQKQLVITSSGYILIYRKQVFM
jgi:hypothetical protein